MQDKATKGPWRPRLVLILTLACAFGGHACTTAYYDVWEALGKEKRDLLKDNVAKAAEEQKETSQQFKDALSHIRSLYGLPQSDLQKLYDQVANDYEASSRKADALRQRIVKVEDIAGDMFQEWEKEIAEISRADLRADSRKKLAATKNRFHDMDASMKRAEKSMEPVLTAFHDQVLYLKHNLNAQAVGVLGKESQRITKDIDELVRLMNDAIHKAEAFSKELPPS